ncbi:11831_t:CDS:2 [Entrophospora sp. SA101]|nr:11831_t:CDS:2 [Entrophospora sp. SA101]CAJ0895146.1 4720_t:CDS:2 [Entrophospora sp. SA101]
MKNLRQGRLINIFNFIKSIIGIVSKTKEVTDKLARMLKDGVIKQSYHSKYSFSYASLLHMLHKKLHFMSTSSSTTTSLSPFTIQVIEVTRRSSNNQQQQREEAGLVVNINLDALNVSKKSLNPLIDSTKNNGMTLAIMNVSRTI